MLTTVKRPLLISFCGRAAVSAPEYTVPEGHTFSGWNIPETMPAENLVLDATLVEDGKYTVSFVVDGETYFTFTGYEGDAITVPENPEKLGYTFDAWDGMPETVFFLLQI